MSRISVLTFFGLATLAFAFGCARSAEEKQLDEMREALTHVDEDPSFGAKLTAKELAEIVKQGGTARRAPFASPQHVMHFEDGAEEDSAPEMPGLEADDPSTRPVLRVHGLPHTRGSDVVEETMPDETAVPLTTQTTTRPTALDPEAKRAYDSALALVNGRQYGPALDAFAGFLLRYPDHPYAANAMYWRGECYFAQGDYVRAVEQFDGVVARFPLGAKTPDALLKLGICQQKLGNPQKAQSYFEKLTREWPRSDAVRLVPSASSTQRTGGAGVEHP